MSALIAFHTGLLVRGDAISNSVRLKLDALERWDPSGHEVRSVVFAQSTDGSDPRVETRTTALELLADPRFREADLHVFEFGIAYDLFDAALLVPSERLAAHYHNVTPPELIDDPYSRGRVELSQLQVHNIAHASRILCDSAFNADDLVARGFDPDRLAVTPLPPAVPVQPRRRPGRERVELLYVGRFAGAKGVDVLLEAYDRLLRRPDAGDVRLTLAGNHRLSGDGVLDRLAQRVGDALRVVTSPTDAELAALYEDADVYVTASRHEGYCVPVLEALAAGCQVVATAAGALPEMVAEHGQLVAIDDADGLAAALARAASAARRLDVPGATVPTSTGLVPVAEWRAETAALAGERTTERCGQRMVAELLPVLERARAAAGSATLRA